MRGWTQGDLCNILRRPLQTINEIINGKKEITPDTAIALGEAFGTSAELWLNLENSYRLARARSKHNDSEIARRARIHSLAPVKELQERGWIRATSSIDELEVEVCRFFALASIDERPKMAIAARRANEGVELSPSQIAWVFRAKHVASKTTVARFSRNEFERLLPSLVKLSTLPDGGIRQAITQLANAGIRVVVISRLPNTRIDGAMFWLNAASPVVAISLRYDRIDSFWFTLMHELAHVHQGYSTNGALDIDMIGETALDAAGRPEYERKADQLASDWLLPSNLLDEFIRHNGPLYSRGSVTMFARVTGVHPGIVVGRLQYRRAIPYSHFRYMLTKVSPQCPAN